MPSELPKLPLELTIPRPDDWHLHLRDGAVLAGLVADSAERFARALIMPNLKPPVVDTEQALAYRERILAARPPGSSFQPLMALYLTDQTPPAEIRRAQATGVIPAVKLYPAGATTHSAAGVTALDRLYPVFDVMQETGMVLSIHGEVTDPAVDIFDREACFIERHLAPLLRDFPGLRVVLEHITTADAVDFVMGAGANLAATITAHHLLYNRNALLAGGVRPHFYCLPVLKRETHRRALIAAATRGDAKFFLGTDSAPHGRGAKECAQGCAGCYTAFAAIELYAEAFEQTGCLERLEGFASRHGPSFYGLPVNSGRIRLVRQPWTVPDNFPFGGETLVPLRAGESIAWRIQAE